MRDADRCGHIAPGGIVGYPLERLHEEVAYLAYHLHWSYADLMDMAVGERHHYVRLLAEQIEQENARIEAAYGDYSSGKIPAPKPSPIDRSPVRGAAALAAGAEARERGASGDRGLAA